MNAVEGHELSKAYRLYRTPKDRIKEVLFAGRRRFHEEVWALRDVSLRVPPGATLGIIGDNGAGKSTLLEILAGTVFPSRGRVHVEGRISAILALGAGFNPEFSGRENVLVNGAILGLNEKEMKARLPAIEAFAEIGDFVDRPVRTYSSGMYVRLAFAVAISVDPDVLIVDEALAVGDQYFQKKCIDRINEFRQAGKTILFCSHNLYQVQMICDQVIWLAEGRIRQIGDARTVCADYESFQRARQAAAQRKLPARPARLTADEHPRIAEVTLGAPGEPGRTTFETGDGLELTVAYEVPRPPVTVNVGVVLARNDDLRVYGTGTHVEELTLPTSSGRVTFTLPALPLLAGEYHFHVHLLDDTGLHPFETRPKACSFSVRHPFPAMGLCRLEHRWKVEPAEERR
jgi:ABC-type polysaccharide/polyol phosphate transport system ATPase subunit